MTLYTFYLMKHLQLELAKFVPEVDLVKMELIVIILMGRAFAIQDT